ncbi:MAG: NYN domain-containing protein [Natronosporangium sp.]
MSDTVVYIDGHNLYHGIRRKFGRKYLWLDVVRLAQHMRQDDRIVKVRYYTAAVRGEPDATHRQMDYLAALAASAPGRIEIVRGHFKAKTFRCPRCGARWTCSCNPPQEYRTYEEKLTDVALGTDMVRDAASGLGDTSVLVSTDTDFHPAIEACLQLAPHRRIFIAYPPGRHSPRNDFDGRVTAFQIPEQHFAAAQLPELVTRGGRSYRRPNKWR